MKNASLTNVVMINGKIRSELNKMDGSIDMLAQRSKDLDGIIQEEEKRKKEEKKDLEKTKDSNSLPNYVDLNNFFNQLKKVYGFNQKINEKFSNLKGELSKFNELNQLFEKMDDIQTMVSRSLQFYIQICGIK